MERSLPAITLTTQSEASDSFGFNVGIRAATGDLVAIVSAHCELEPDYISQCVSCLERSGADNVGGPMRPASESFWSRTIGLATSTPFGIGNSQFHYSQKEQFVDTVYMGMYRREMLARDRPVRRDVGAQSGLRTELSAARCRR